MSACLNGAILPLSSAPSSVQYPVPALLSLLAFLLFLLFSVYGDIRNTYEIPLPLHYF